MKTKLLLAATLLLSIGLFAQEVNAINDQATSASAKSGNAGSSGNVSNSSSSPDVITTQKTVKENSNGSGSVQSESHIGAESKSNKVSQNAYLNNKANVSAEVVKSTGNETKKEVKMDNERAKTDVKNNIHNTITAGTRIASKAKPKLAAFRMQTQIKSNARLKIK